MTTNIVNAEEMYEHKVITSHKKYAEYYGLAKDTFIVGFNPGFIVDYRKDDNLGDLHKEIEITVDQNIDETTGKGGWIPGDIIGSYKEHQFVVQDLPVKDGFNYKYNIVSIEKGIVDPTVLEAGLKYIVIGQAYRMS